MKVRQSVFSPKKDILYCSFSERKGKENGRTFIGNQKNWKNKKDDVGV